MRTKQKTLVTLDLADELTEEELASIRRIAQSSGHTLQEHVWAIMFGHTTEPSNKSVEKQNNKSEEAA